ncbi:MAG: NPCBM/NEW2 domain-containing protein, partial [Chloroflexi bacterium]|nr:NPCBM/NEW2 domain-containing protein [Chloroflexota bacterium]
MKTARLRRLRWPGRPERPQKRTVRWQFALRLFALLIVPLALPVQSEAITAQRPLVAPAAPESLRIAATIGTCAPDEQTAGKWHYLSDIPWQSATSGWQAIADVAVPERDRSFRGVSLALGGTTYEKGLLTHPLAEVTYQLNGRYSALQAIAGLTENSPDGASTVFLVYADDALVYNSGVVAAGEPPRQIDLCVAGVDHLRLVTAGAGQRTPAIEHKMSEIAGGYAAWVDPRIFRPDAPAPATPAVRRTLAAEHTMRWEQVIGEQSLYQEQGVAEMAALVERFGPPGRSGNWPRETQMFRDEQQRLVLANRRLAVLFGFAGAEHATLTVVDTRNGTLVVTGAGSAISSAAGVMSVA